MFLDFKLPVDSFHPILCPEKESALFKRTVEANDYMVEYLLAALTFINRFNS
jgi:hypothetical protein